MSNLLEELKYRDLVYQQTDEEGIKKLEKKNWKFSIFSNETEEDFESNPRIASFLIRELWNSLLKYWDRTVEDLC